MSSANSYIQILDVTMPQESTIWDELGYINDYSTFKRITKIGGKTVRNINRRFDGADTSASRYHLWKLANLSRFDILLFSDLHWEIIKDNLGHDNLPTNIILRSEFKLWFSVMKL